MYQLPRDSTDPVVVLFVGKTENLLTAQEYYLHSDRAHKALFRWTL